MSPAPLILLPPSEGKAPDGDGPRWQRSTMAVGALDVRRMDVLRALGPRHPVRRGPTMAAIDRYTGVLYRELDAASLAPAARVRLDEQVLIVSGCWGLVAPPDPIPHYKLKMSANLPPLGKLSTWWRPSLTRALAARADGAVVWDLLPIEHSAAIRWDDVAPTQRITVRFVDAQGKTVNHWNKLLKGSLVRWLVGSARRSPGDLARFDHPLGYRYDPDATIDDGTVVAVTFREVG